MKLEPNWRFKSLNSLEKTTWEKPTYDSYLVKTVHRLRSVPLNEYQIEDLRIMIGQNIGLKYLIPLAIEELEVNLFAEGDYYEGDLLQMVLNADKNYWINNHETWQKTKELIDPHFDKLSEARIKFSHFITIFD